MLRVLRRQGRWKRICWMSWRTRLRIRVMGVLGNIGVSRRLGKRRRHAVSWIHATGRGESAGGAGPSLRETIVHRRLSVWMGKGSNDTVDGMRCPRGISATGPGDVRKNGINITRLSVNQVIFQGYLEGSFFGLRKMGDDILADGSWKGAKKPVHINPIFEGRGSTQAPSSSPFLNMGRKAG